MNVLLPYFFLVGIVLLVTIFYIGFRKNQRLPPGPFGIPFFGYYPFLGKNPWKTLNELGKKYGSVIGLYLGPKYVVVFNDWEAMTNAFSKHESLYRPSNIFENVPYNFGVVGANGSEWSTTRRLMSRVMKDVSLNQTKWEKLLQEELYNLIQCIRLHGPKPMNVKNLFAETFANNIISLLFGERVYSGHHFTKEIVRAVDTIIEFNPTLGMINFSPTLQRFLEVVGCEKPYRLLEEIKYFISLINDVINEKLSKPENCSVDSFIDNYRKELQKVTENKLDENAKDTAFKGNTLAMLAGGSETSRTTMVWALIAMADNPEIQKKVQQELDIALEGREFIPWSERSKIPYTYATVLEATRWRTVVPISTGRMAAEDIQVQGYHIPKGTFMTSNLWAIHNDTKFWDEPEKFLPERFLTDDGKKVDNNPRSFSPFSYGKRNCPGKLIAMIEILLFFSIIMHKFTVVSSDGKKVKYNTLLGLTFQAMDVDLCFIPRK